MRYFSILTATLVCIATYLAIMERDLLLGFAANAADTPTAAEETAPAEAAITPTTKDPAVSVVVLRSEEQIVQNALVLRGKTEAARKVTVKAETSGVNISEPLRQGQKVKAGDLLCKLDPGTREANLAQAKAALAEAKLNEKAASTLAQRGFTAETTAAARKAALEAAEAAVESAQKEIDRLEIHAPFDGILESDTAELGEYLTIGSGCATLMNLDTMKMIGYVSERDIDRISLGNMAQATLLDGRQFTGAVSFLSSSADSLTRTFEVNVEVANPDGAIRDGSTVELMIELRGEPGHLVPQMALTLDDNGTLGVRLNKDGKAKFAPVTLLRDALSGIWLKGLPEMAEVIIVGQEFVNDGQELKITYEGDTNS